MARGHRIEASVKDPNVAIAVDMHPDDLAPTAPIHAFGNGRPALDEPIRVGELGWLGVPSLLGLRRGSKRCCDAVLQFLSNPG